MGAEVDIEAELTALAARQYGVVARRQLLRMGLGEKAIAYRVRRGRLIVLHRGVYALGHRVLRAEGHWLAAVLACGDRAVLSGVSAAAAWGPRPAPARPLDVAGRAAPGRRPQAGVRLHRRAGLRDDETAVHRAIPITTGPDGAGPRGDREPTGDRTSPRPGRGPGADRDRGTRRGPRASPRPPGH